MFRYTCTHLQALEDVISYLQKHPLHTLKKVSFFRFHRLLRYMRNRKQLPWTGKNTNKNTKFIKKFKF